MSYEETQKRLTALLEECFSDDNGESGSDEEIDHCSQRSEESDSEQDVIFDEEDTDEDNDARGSFFISKNGTKWNKDCSRPNIRTRAENIITNPQGVKGAAKNVQTEYECWNLFITDTMLNDILMYTNNQINTKRISCRVGKEQYHMKDVTIEELKSFLGLVYIAGLNRSNRQNLSDLWRTDGTGIDIFRSTMSLQRFYFLQNCLRFDDKNTREERKKVDNLAAIRNLFDGFVDNCLMHYVPSEYLTIDEMLLSFRGRCAFRVYIPNKPAKYGIKIYAIVDAKTFYILKLEVYAGKQPTGPFQLSNKSFDVVDRLVQPVTMTCRNLSFDNWFTGYPLMIHLLKEHKLTSVGTVRKNKSTGSFQKRRTSKKFKIWISK